MHLGRSKALRTLPLLVAFALIVSTLFSPTLVKTFAQGKTTLIVHYKEDPNTDKDWNIWAFPDGGEGQAFPFTGNDDFGRVAQIELEGDLEKVGFIVRTDDWDKDGEDRFVDVVDGKAEAWVVAGNGTTFASAAEASGGAKPAAEGAAASASSAVSVSPVPGKTKAIVHYKKDPSSKESWNLWGWPEGGDGAVYQFNSEDAWGQVGEILLDGDVKRVGFIVRTDEWKKDGDQDRYVEIKGGVGEVWIKGGDGTVYTSPPDGEYRTVRSHENLSVTIHYSRYDNQYDGWNLLMWPGDKEGQQVNFTGEDDYGKIAKAEFKGANASQIGFTVRKSVAGNDNADKEFSDRFITTFDEKGNAEIWIAQGQEKVYNERPPGDDIKPRFKSAKIDDLNLLTVETNYVFDAKAANNADITIEGMTVKSVEPVDQGHGSMSNIVKVTTEENFELTKSYKLSKPLFGDATVSIGDVVRSDGFDELFYYDGNDLGNTYTKEETKFRVWAPTAGEAKLVTYEKWDSETGTETAMERSDKGTWTAALKGDQKGVIYTYKVKIGDHWNEAVDPYARAVTVNGDRGAIVDLAETNPKDFKATKKAEFVKAEDAIIYELHVRDATIHPESGVDADKRGKYLGLTQKGTKGPNGISTGLDYLKELGITHVQLMPSYDYSSVDETKLDTPQFNWGYDPKNFNTPEGSYSSDPYEPTARIKEMKQMIQAMHENGLRVTMDVVYNHMYAVNPSNFENLVPGYYFRYNEEGKLSNGTGVGNDTASDHKMMRKFIIDSTQYWVNEYNIDGFRFDLMGIHDVETMNQVRDALLKIDPTLLLIGEGWDLPTALDPEIKAKQSNAAKFMGIGQFNDGVRDGLKGSIFIFEEQGFVNGNVEATLAAKQGIVGAIEYNDEITSWAKDPQQSVTYAEAHDNHTIWDKLQISNPDANDADRSKMHRMISSIIMTSQGIAFLHAGQEFMRTKGGDDNSYKSSDAVNQLDWQRRLDRSADVDYMKGLIQLRKTHPAFRMATADEIRSNLKFIPSPESTIVYELNGDAVQDSSEQIIVAHNANAKEVTVDLPKAGKWNLVVNGEKAGLETIQTVEGSKFTLPALSTYVLITEPQSDNSTLWIGIGIAAAVLVVGSGSWLMYRRFRKAA
ncbi:type I pullulanase [Paenibacillus oenotherae]|uniref:pullulanase n=1 Tax=Paenibacillus oenotherae TaxID=1435645 RepID=A0ABS7D8M4_9BACL|nr:type I pullulanase [Paenibacillus oenotherae]MBW7476139.1 type I pullulanase [Paenibacillus oenotherae]